MARLTATEQLWLALARRCGLDASMLGFASEFCGGMLERMSAKAHWKAILVLLKNHSEGEQPFLPVTIQALYLSHCQELESGDTLDVMSPSEGIGLGAPHSAPTQSKHASLLPAQAGFATHQSAKCPGSSLQTAGAPKLGAQYGSNSHTALKLALSLPSECYGGTILVLHLAKNEAFSLLQQLYIFVFMDI